MIKGIIFFLGLWAFVTGCIGVWRQMTGKERWSTVKVCSYGAATALLAFVILVGIVILF